MKIFCELTSCCCGCSLRKGSLLISFFSSLVGLIQVISSIFLIVLVAEDMKNNHDHPVNNLGSQLGLWIYCLIMYSVYLVMCILLMFGVAKGYQKLILPWIGFSTISALNNCAVGFFNSITIATTNGIIAPWAGISFMLVIAIFCLEWYLISVIYSYYKELNSTDNEILQQE